MKVLIFTICFFVLKVVAFGQEAVYDAANHATNITQANYIKAMNKNLIDISKDTHSKMDYQSNKLNNLQNISEETLKKIDNIMDDTHDILTSKGKAEDIKVGYQPEKYNADEIQDKNFKDFGDGDEYETQEKLIEDYKVTVGKIYTKRTELLGVAENLAEKIENAKTDVEVEKSKAALAYIQTNLQVLADKEASAKAKIDVQNGLIQQSFFKSINEEMQKSKDQLEEFFTGTSEAAGEASKNNPQKTATVKNINTDMPINLLGDSEQYDLFRGVEGFKPPPPMDPNSGGVNWQDLTGDDDDEQDDGK